MALGNILITAVPTPGGVVSSKYRDGNDAGASPPTTPQIGQPNVLNDDAVDIPLVTASTGGTAPRVYELSLSSTSAVAGWSVKSADADFSGDGICTVIGLTASTAYWAKLACVDADLRRSGYSGIYTFTTAAAGGGDTTAPTAPSNLSATSTIAGQASLTWTNGTDAVGIAFTDVLRGTAIAGVPQSDGVTINTVVGTGSSYTDISAPAGSEVFYKVQHRDAAGNTSARSAASVATIASASVVTKKWHPGHGVKTGVDVATAASLSSQRTNMADVQDSANLKFVWGNLRWGRLNPTGTTYDWTELEAHLARASALGSKLMLEVAFKTFPGSSGNTTSMIMPADLLPAGAPANAAGQYVSALWRQPIMDRYIAFMRALAVQYDGDARLEGVTWSETATGGSNIADFSYAGYADQLLRLYAAVGSAFTNTFVYAYINTLTDQVSRLVAGAYAAGIGFGCPDARDKQGNMTFRGAASDGGYAAIDYRNKMPFATIVSISTLNETGPAATVVNWLQTEQATHAAWINYSSATETWAQYLAAIAADSAWHTTYPTG